MGGGTVPYHLRQNKAIDRNIFIELLSRLNRYVDIERYTYIGFGGPFLEDFKAIHASTGIDKMISIEINEKVLARQKFNLPLNCIDTQLAYSGDFIRAYGFEGHTIVWLDYVKPSELGGQLNEVEFLLTRLQDQDIVKITLNANANSLADSQQLKQGEVLNEKRLQVLRSRIEKYLPYGISEEMMHNDLYPIVLCKSILNAVQKGMSGKPDSYLQPLTAFVYADSQHRMLTFTGIILPDKETEDFFRTTGLSDWRLLIPEDYTPRVISVPELSIRERLFIDSLLPNSTDEAIHNELGFLVDETEGRSLEGLKNYVRYYKQYPYFSKVLI